MTAIKQDEKCDHCGHHAVRVRICKVCADASDITYDQMQEYLEGQVEALKKREASLVKALELIKSYSSKHNPGCCDYGCDTPSIAEAALNAGKGESC